MNPFNDVTLPAVNNKVT